MHIKCLLNKDVYATKTKVKNTMYQLNQIWRQMHAMLIPPTRLINGGNYVNML